MSDFISLLDEATLKVSSTLDKSVGKRHLVDKSPETCWTSQQGLPQYIQINFKESRVQPARLSLTFQGGFVGTRCVLHAQSSTSQEWKIWTNVYPEDVNRQQAFDLPTLDETEWKSGLAALKLVFEESSDFFGRITVYDLSLEGRIVTA